MKLKLWGVRGSVPSPGKSTVHFGGNTSCIELVSAQNDLIILDSGSGIRNLGSDLLQRQDRNPIQADILFDTSLITTIDVTKTARTEMMDIFNYSEIEGGIRIAMTGIGHQIDPGTGVIADIIATACDDIRLCHTCNIIVNGCEVTDPQGEDIPCEGVGNYIHFIEPNR